jgi:purine-binding chemotaxis protein CheW
MGTQAAALAVDDSRMQTVDWGSTAARSEPGSSVRVALASEARGSSAHVHSASKDARERADGASKDARERADGASKDARERADGASKDARERADGASEDARERANAGLIQFISFSIDNDQYGVDIMSVREIKGWSEITHIPKQPEHVRGVLNLRGVMVPIIDLRCRFGQGLTQATPIHIVIIVQVGARQVGLLADRVLDIVSSDASQIQPVPRIAQASRIDFLSGLVTVEDSMIALIDLPNLLSAPVSAHEEASATERKRAATAARR